MEAFAIGTSIASILLAFLATGLSVYFYTQAKNTESNVQIALAGISAETQALKTLNQRSLDRLTKYATSPQPEVNLAIETMAKVLSDMPRTLGENSLPGPDADVASLQSAVLDLHILLLHYAGQTNVWAAALLPDLDSFDGSDEQTLIRNAVDHSAADFQIVANLLDGVDAERLQASHRLHIYHEAKSLFQPIVGDALTLMSRPRTEESESG